MFGLFVRLVIRGIRDLFLHPWLQTLTLAAVILVTLLSGMFLLVLHNLDQQMKKNQGQIQFQVYWESTMSTEKVSSQWRELESLPNLASLRTITPEEALEILSDSLAMGINLKHLRGESPLPHTALLQFDLGAGFDKDWAKDMYAYLQGLDQVRKVTFNPLQMDLASSWIKFGKRVLWPMIAFLTLVLALIVGNTIKLSLFHRQKEVEILRLVGASRFYIQMPLLAGGAFQGFTGSVVALGLLKFIQIGMKNLLNFPPLWLQVEYLPYPAIGGLVLALTFVGVVSSWVAIRF